jgi:hypothetical protein
LLLRKALIAALSLMAAPALAGTPPAALPAPAAASSTAPAIQAVAAKEPAAGTCSTCSTEAAEGTCTAPQAGAGAAQQISDEEWREFVRRKIAAEEAPKPEPVDPDPFSFSVYQGRRPEFMGEQTIINGAKMRIASLIVPDSQQTVAQAYYDTFERMGFRPLVGEVPNTRGVRYLSFRPTGSKNLKTITLVPHGEGTIILASVGNPEEMLTKKPELPGEVPVPPRAEAASVIQQMEPGLASRSAFFVVRESSPESVRGFYREELRQRGFSAVQAAEGQDSESFEKNGMMVSISAKPHTEPGTVAVSLFWLQ